MVEKLKEVMYRPSFSNVVEALVIEAHRAHCDEQRENREQAIFDVPGVASISTPGGAA